jgi:hypothetical protein
MVEVSSCGRRWKTLVMALVTVVFRLGVLVLGVVVLVDDSGRCGGFVCGPSSVVASRRRDVMLIDSSSWHMSL